jgi:hypothetical protein
MDSRISYLGFKRVKDLVEKIQAFAVSFQTNFRKTDSRDFGR